MFGGVVLAKVLGLTAGGGEVIVAPLLATQILWINLVTDGAPALALGLDPADPDVMRQPPRPRGSGVITGRMWAGIIFVGLIMAAGSLLVLDAALPGGFIPGSGDIEYGRTMIFTTLILFQMFNVFNARSDTHSVFYRLFHNPPLWGAVALSLVLQLAVIYVPFLQSAFDTVPLRAGDWLFCILVASSVLWLRELSKLVLGITRRSGAASER
jgi:Ca2+-transporting ATPase